VFIKNKKWCVGKLGRKKESEVAESFECPAAAELSHIRHSTKYIEGESGNEHICMRNTDLIDPNYIYVIL